MLSKEAVLAASDRQLNELCATKIHGWTLEHPQIRNARYRNAEGDFMGMRFNYTPTTNIEQAIELLDKLREVHQLGWYLGTTKPNHYTVQIQDKAGSCQESLTRAIVLAALLAIVEMG